MQEWIDVEMVRQEVHGITLDSNESSSVAMKRRSYIWSAHGGVADQSLVCLAGFSPFGNWRGGRMSLYRLEVKPSDDIDARCAAARRSFDG